MRQATLLEKTNMSIQDSEVADSSKHPCHPYPTPPPPHPFSYTYAFVCKNRLFNLVGMRI